MYILYMKNRKYNERFIPPKNQNSEFFSTIEINVAILNLFRKKFLKVRSKQKKEVTD